MDIFVLVVILGLLDLADLDIRSKQSMQQLFVALPVSTLFARSERAPQQRIVAIWGIYKRTRNCYLPCQ